MFEDPQLTWQNLHNPAYLFGGKTIVGALAFGLIAVELTKRYIGLTQSTGDLYAIPLALGIAIGRIGCFLTGLSDNTYGTPTHLPWAVNFGDSIPRHPTQLYESFLLLALVPILLQILKKVVILNGAVTKQSEVTAQSKDSVPTRSSDAASRRLPGALFSEAETKLLTANNERPATIFLPGDAFKFFMVAYMSFRLLCDFLKPYPRLFLGLGGIQWACVLTLLYYSRDIARWLRRAPVLAPART